MADITMCEDGECPKRENCHRYKAKPDKYRQSYFLESPRDGGSCGAYWPLDDYDVAIQEKLGEVINGDMAANGPSHGPA